MKPLSEVNTKASTPRENVPERTSKKVFDVLSQIIRAITVPPILVSVLLCVLYGLNLGVYASVSELIFSLIFLVIVPLIAYPVAYLVPKLRSKGRNGQRNTAFLFSLLGYAGGLIYGLVAQVNKGLLLIFFTYLVSVVVLLIFNKLIKTRASGHACGTTGPLIFFVYFTGLVGLVPCVLIAVGVVWSSLRLKRHTPLELLLGAVTALISFLLGLVLVWFL